MSDSVALIKQYRDKLSDMKSRLAVLVSKRDQAEADLKELDTKVKAVVGDQDPDIYLEAMRTRLEELKGKLDAALEKANQVLLKLEE